ncbi:flagellin [Methylobacterium sp. 1030]|uniref:flagellin N-terminal helical domain-containing protein n=1 Tax=Methylobacterium sp. 1030 TaxID=3156404 RepID=UPI0033935056
MSSLLTNTSAMTALTTLKMTNQTLDQSSSRISTGLKVANSSDNAAYWSIATTIRADNGSLSAVKDALGLGSNSVDVAYNGVNSVITQFQSIKDKLTAALSPNVDRGKIQTEINDVLKAIKQTADASVVSGEAWLSTDSSAGNYTSDRKIVSSFTRTQGVIAVDTLTVSVDDTKLYDATTTAGTANGDAAGGTLVADWKTAQTTMDTAQKKFDASAKDATAQSDLDTAKSNYATAQTTFKNGVKSANAAATAGADGAGGLLNKQWAVSGADNNGLNKGYALSVGQIDIADIQNSDLSKLNAYISLADKALTAMTNVATTLGSAKSQITSQTNFVDSLIKANERSIGTLVDADMEEESTRLKALQVQQQLGMQSLTIANSNTQQILSLFR